MSGEAVLLQARCPAGHTWDVWGEETDRPGHPAVDRRDLACPTCEPHGIARAERLDYPQALS